MRSDERGAVLLIAAASLIALLGFATLIVDLGDSRQLTRQNQSVSDMASSAAAIELSSSASDHHATDNAHLVAADFVGRNLDVSIASTVCRTPNADLLCYAAGDTYVEIETPHAGLSSVPAYQQVWVNVCSQSSGFFAPALGLAPSEVCRDATAILDETIVISPAILALDPTGPQAFHLEGVARAVGVGGSLVANSSSSSGFHMKDATSATATDPTSCICAVGGVSLAGAATVSPIATAGSMVATDPWASLVEPTVISSGSYNSATKTFAPGLHGSIILDKPGTYTFSPGIHEFTGQFKIEGAGIHVVAENVLWYFGPGSSASASWASGPNTIRVSSRPSNEYYGGNNGEFPPIAILQARTNTNAFSLGDNVSVGHVSASGCVVDSSAGITGGVYLPTAELQVRGNTGSGLCTEGAPVVAYRVQIQETGFVQGATDGSAGTSTRSTRLAD